MTLLRGREDRTVGAYMHNRTARAQAGRDREVERALSALPTSASFDELEQRLSAALEYAEPHRPAWWRARPGGR